MILFLQKDKDYYIQGFWKNLHKLKKKKKVVKYIFDDLKFSSDNSDEGDSNNKDQKEIIVTMVFVGDNLCIVLFK